MQCSTQRQRLPGPQPLIERHSLKPSHSQTLSLALKHVHSHDSHPFSLQRALKVKPNSKRRPKPMLLRKLPQKLLQATRLLHSLTRFPAPIFR